MKGLISLVVFCICLGLGIWGDIVLCTYLTSLIPINEWAGIIKAGIAVAVIVCTASLILTISLLAGTFARAMLGK
jgi:hypothetical protein